MILSKKGAAFIRLHEGFRSKAYRDPINVRTIGIGFTWGSAAFRRWWKLYKFPMTFDDNATMTEAEADDALQFIVKHEYGTAVDLFLGTQKVPQHVYDAMVSAVFNLGPKALEWRWAAAVKDGDYKLAATLLKRTGTTAKGKTLPGLVRRRMEEAILIRMGVYTGVPASREWQERNVPKPNSVSAKPNTVSPTPPRKLPGTWWQRLFGLVKKD